ncbi:cytochrome c oxidase subunit NDUFA4-like [Rhopilema esculentum]|uniref:cytochrome c oxidase subunit NDUFA4-like n=1 Tax=Rhopilema esculentum TaxID=499914 RepID=UPI0031E08A85
MNYLNKHKELIPLFAVTGIGMVGAGYYLARLALKCPDVSWDRKNNQHPWLKIKSGESIKFFQHKDITKVMDHMQARPEEVKNI